MLCPVSYETYSVLISRYCVMKSYSVDLIIFVELTSLWTYFILVDLYLFLYLFWSPWFLILIPGSSLRLHLLTHLSQLLVTFSYFFLACLIIFFFLLCPILQMKGYRGPGLGCLLQRTSSLIVYIFWVMVLGLIKPSHLVFPLLLQNNLFY